MKESLDPTKIDVIKQHANAQMARAVVALAELMIAATPEDQRGTSIRLNNPVGNALARLSAAEAAAAQHGIPSEVLDAADAEAVTRIVDGLTKLPVDTAPHTSVTETT